MMKRKDYRPIVCVYRGDNKHLSAVIAQARASNPEHEFILLGDELNAYYSGVSHFRMADYFESATEFSDIYRFIESDFTDQEHLAKFFIQRWLVLAEFMEKEGLTKLFNIDGDIFIYDKINEIRCHQPEGDMTVMLRPELGEVLGAGIAHGGSMFIERFEIIAELRDFIFDIFKDQNLFNYMKEKYRAINEMDILSELMHRNPGKVKDLNYPLNQKQMQYDMTVHCIMNRISNEEGYDSIIWKGGIPYGQFSYENDLLIEYSLLHMGGVHKVGCSRYLRGLSLLNWVLFFYNRIKFRIMKLFRKTLRRLWSKLFKRKK